MKLLVSAICFVAVFASLEARDVKNIKEVMETEVVATPQYLYKILSLRNWQATQCRNFMQLSADDAAFIHFSTEDQLERILKKYWSDAPQFVVLKIDSSKLEGRMVFETNPGGSAKYYHLYEGSIPLSSIVESKIVYQKPMGSEAPKQAIVQIGDPTLRQQAKELSAEEILSPEIQDLIATMKATMRAAPGVGLAAPQIGKSLQIVVIEDIDHNHLTAQQLAERNRYPVPFHVLINPRLFIEESANKAAFFEGCLSVTEMLGVVPRADAVRVECLNEKAEPVTIHAKGWYARILQHEIDHLNGTLFIDRAIPSTLTCDENFDKLWKKKSAKEIAELLPKNNR